MKKFLSFLILSVLFVIPSINAEELDTISVNNALQKDQILYGNEVYFGASTSDPNKYQIFEYLCDDDLNCIDSTEGNYHSNVKSGKYYYGFKIKPIGDNTLASSFSWNINNTITTPMGCGQSGENDLLGCQFYEVEVKDWEVKISDINITNVKTDFQVGDKPTFTGKVDGTQKDYYTIVEGWCDENDFYSPTTKCVFSDSSVTTLTKFEAKKYYYVITYYAKDESYAFMTQNPTINGVKYEVNENITGMADYNFGKWVFFSITPTINVISDNGTTEEDTQTAEEVSNVITKAIENIDDDKTIEGITKEVVNKIKTAIEEGKTIKTEIVSNNITESNISDTVKEKVEQTKESTSKVLGYFDINLEIKTDNDALGRITKLENAIRITIDTKELVKSLPTIEAGKTRKFSVIRIHEGETDILEATLNEDNTLSFNTDRFSDYIVVYNDISTNSNTSNPQTGDNIILYISMLGLSLIVLICGGIYIKKKCN